MLHSGYRSASFQRPSRRSNTEMYSSGRRGRTRNAIGRVTGARVQLPSSPLLKKTCPVIRAGLFHVLTNAFAYSSLIFFLTYSCFRLLFFDILFNAYFSHAASFYLLCKKVTYFFRYASVSDHQKTGTLSDAGFVSMLLYRVLNAACQFAI